MHTWTKISLQTKTEMIFPQDVALHKSTDLPSKEEEGTKEGKERFRHLLSLSLLVLRPARSYWVPGQRRPWRRAG
uniref:Uncharacterized protein n=1 Tax=Setaria italica TaxID=4555 RepID=K4AHK2_SETIT